MGYGRSAVAVLLAGMLAAGCGDDDAGAEDAGGVDAGGGPIEDGGGPAGDGGGTADGGGDVDGGAGGGSACAPLGPSGGTAVTVGPSEADALVSMVRDAAPGTTFLLEDGTYTFSGGDEASRRLQIRAEGVTLRSASNDAEAVIIDGEYLTNEILTVQASNATVAHVTITRAVDHPIHVTPGDAGDVVGTRLYGLRIIDGGEQFVKINPNGARDAYVDDGVVECSLFRMTDGGRPNVERDPGGCYTGGIDAHSARGWEVRNNRFEDIYCAGEGLAEHAVHFWSASRDTVVENNVILGCARGVGFGLVESGATRDYDDDPYPGVGYVGHYDGIIRNNVIFADHAHYDTGIELAQARGVRVYHNTVWSTDAATGFFSSIDYRFTNTDAAIRNNVTRRITQRNGATGTVDHNLEGVEASLFEDVGARDFHLAPGADSAIDQGVELEGAGLDMDGEAHDAGEAPDIGADEAG